MEKLKGWAKGFGLFLGSDVFEDSLQIVQLAISPLGLLILLKGLWVFLGKPTDFHSVVMIAGSLLVVAFISVTFYRTINNICLKLCLLRESRGIINNIIKKTYEEGKEISIICRGKELHYRVIGDAPREEKEQCQKAQS
jgi:hypothetical protein